MKPVFHPFPILTLDELIPLSFGEGGKPSEEQRAMIGRVLDTFDPNINMEPFFIRFRHNEWGGKYGDFFRSIFNEDLYDVLSADMDDNDIFFRAYEKWYHQAMEFRKEKLLVEEAVKTLEDRGWQLIEPEEK